jgi:hypothetical protein
LLVENGVTVGQLWKYLCQNIDHNPSSFLNHLVKDLQLKRTQNKTPPKVAKKKEVEETKSKARAPKKTQQQPKQPAKKITEQTSSPRNTHPMPTRSKRKAEGNSQEDTDWAQLAPVTKKTKR